MLAMTYGHAYVARVAMAAKDAQTVNAFKEADSYPGTSLIIAYSPLHRPRLRHDRRASSQQELAVNSGYWPLFRYDPRRAAAGESPLKLDSGGPQGRARRVRGHARPASGRSSSSTRRTTRSWWTRPSGSPREKYALYEQLAKAMNPVNLVPGGPVIPRPRRRPDMARRHSLAVAALALASLAGVRWPRTPRPCAFRSTRPCPYPGRACRTARRGPSSVSGDGKVSVAPDSASFTVGVEATARTVGAATAEVTEKMKAVLDAVARAGVAGQGRPHRPLRRHHRPPLEGRQAAAHRRLPGLDGGRREGARARQARDDPRRGDRGRVEPAPLAAHGEARPEAPAARGAGAGLRGGAGEGQGHRRRRRGRARRLLHRERRRRLAPPDAGCP